MYGILDIILDGIRDIGGSIWERVSTIGFPNFIHRRFLGGSMGYLLAWIYWLVILGCLAQYVYRFIKNWVGWLKMPKTSSTENKDISSDPAFTVRLEVLKGKASRLSMKLWGELEDMEKGGMARPEDEGYATYSNALALATAYDEIIEAKPTTVFDLEELEWKFNEGKLRTPDEVEEHKAEVDKRLYVESGQYDFEFNMLQDEFLNRHLLTGCVVTCLLMSAILCICCTEGTDGSSMFVTCFFIGLPLMAPAMAILFGTLIFIDLTFESKFYTVAKKAGKRYLPQLQTGIDVAGLAISLHSLGKMFKRKK